MLLIACCAIAAGHLYGQANTPIQQLLVIFDENNSFDTEVGTTVMGHLNVISSQARLTPPALPPLN
jgi:phospholipase C